MSGSVKYVKLTARPGTWYKAGTEIFWEDCVSDEPREVAIMRRMTLDEWDNLDKNAGIGCVGIRVCEDNPNERGNGWSPGEERWDGEWCSVDEFDVEIVEEGTP